MAIDTKELLKKSLEESIKESSEGFSAEEKAKCEVLMKKMIDEEITPQDAMGLDKTFLEQIYATALTFFQAGKYQKAEGMYRILMTLNPLDERFPMATAACLHKLNKYEEAIQYYGLTSAITPNDPLPFFYSSDCFIKCDAIVEAAVMLKLVLQRVNNQPQYAILKERAERSLESSENEINGGGDL